MLSEFLREAAVLVLVFALLDKVVGRGHGLGWNVGVTALIIVISAALFWWGMTVEERQAIIPAPEQEEEVEDEDDN